MDLDQVDSVLSTCENLALVESVNGVRWKFVHDKIPESIVNAIDKEKSKLICNQLAAHFFSKLEKSADEIYLTARLFVNGTVEQNEKNTIKANVLAGD